MARIIEPIKMEDGRRLAAGRHGVGSPSRAARGPVQRADPRIGEGRRVETHVDSGDGRVLHKKSRILNPNFGPVSVSTSSQPHGQLSSMTPGLTGER